ncbi:MAG: 50S ribosomal protein L17 [Nitrospirae bacterium]|nr:50S ribosomal protein L17 [Nitrospirota bacterium]
MRHKKAGRQLSRDSKHRKALFRNLVTSILEHGKIETTLPKAKTIRPIVEKMITIGKSGTLHDRRRALAYVKSESVVSMLFDTLAPRLLDRAGGYTRIVRTRRRLGDSAEMAIVELIDIGKISGKDAKKEADKKETGKKGV